MRSDEGLRFEGIPEYESTLCHTTTAGVLKFYLFLGFWTLPLLC